jgi:hypothetical protein
MRTSLIALSFASLAVIGSPAPASAAGNRPSSVLVVDAGSTGTRIWEYSCADLKAKPKDQGKFNALAGTVGSSAASRKTECETVAHALVTKIEQLKLPAYIYGTAGFLDAGKKYGDALFLAAKAPGEGCHTDVATSLIKANKVINEGPFGLAGATIRLNAEENKFVKGILESGGASVQINKASGLAGMSRIYSENAAKIREACVAQASKNAQECLRVVSGAVTAAMKKAHGFTVVADAAKKQQYGLALGGISFAGSMFTRTVGRKMTAYRDVFDLMGRNDFKDLRMKACAPKTKPANDHMDAIFKFATVNGDVMPCYVASFYEAVFLVSPFERLLMNSQVHDAWTVGAAKQACDAH